MNGTAFIGGVEPCARAGERGRVRLTYVACAAATIGIGLVIARVHSALPAALADKLGDALWAMMMFWLVSVAVTRTRALARGGIALGICVAVESSQLYHTPGLDALRRTTLGHLVLGSGFDSGDLAACAVGVVATVLLEGVGPRFGRSAK